jgi:glycosyltransferase involved in cell wall biosynthesis
METPFFSIVIPTYNRPERLSDCVNALAALDYPRDRYEVIVVDDGSEVDLAPAVAAVQGTISLQLLRQENQGPAAARNRGARLAKGDFLAFTDDDCAPLPDWLRAFATQFEQTPEALVGGYSINALENNPYSTASQQLIDYLYSYYNGAEKSISFFASNNIALPRAGFEAIGGFDVAFPLAAAEDREFCDRWLHEGHSMAYAPQARIRHAHSLSLASFWKQHFGYGRGAYCFHQARAQRDATPMAVEPLSFYTNLLTYPLQQKSQHSGLFLSALLFLSQFATTAGFFRERLSAQS